MLKIKTVFVNKSHEKINKCVSHVQQNIVSMLSVVLMNVKKKNKKNFINIKNKISYISHKTLYKVRTFVQRKTFLYILYIYYNT